MGCTTCGGTVGSPLAVVPAPRQDLPGAGVGLVLVEWLGDLPLVIQTSEREYLFTVDRRRLYMTAADYAAAAMHMDGIAIVESVVSSGGAAPAGSP